MPYNIHTNWRQPEALIQFSSLAQQKAATSDSYKFTIDSHRTCWILFSQPTCRHCGDPPHLLSPARSNQPMSRIPSAAAPTLKISRHVHRHNRLFPALSTKYQSRTRRHRSGNNRQHPVRPQDRAMRQSRQPRIMAQLKSILLSSAPPLLRRRPPIRQEWQRLLPLWVILLVTPQIGPPLSILRWPNWNNNNESQSPKSVRTCKPTMSLSVRILLILCATIPYPPFLTSIRM